MAITAPKGLLKILILDLASGSPISGVGIGEKVAVLSGRSWTPSPGSIYFVLRNLLRNEYITEIYTSDRGMKKYVTTSKGKALLILERDKLGAALKKSLILTSILARLVNSREAMTIADVLEPLSEALVGPPK